MLVYVYFQLTKTRSEGDVTKVKRGFYGFKTKPGKAAKVLTRLLKASFRNDFNFSNLQMGSVILECFPRRGCQAAYRIYSNKRRSAYLIFRATSAALI
mgnify:CR=1 FL=1